MTASSQGLDKQDVYVRRRSASIPSGEASSELFGENTTDGAKPHLAVDDEPDWYAPSGHSPAYASALAEASRPEWVPVPGHFSSLFGFPTAEAFAAEHLRQKPTRQTQLAFEGPDGMVVPEFLSSEQVAQDSIGGNSKLSTYVASVNLLGRNVLAIPAGFRQDGTPFGMLLIPNRSQEGELDQLARHYDFGETIVPGATGINATEPVRHPNTAPLPNDNVQVGVFGAHVNGFPLNRDLTSQDAKLDQATTTSASHCLYSLDSAVPPPPGLRRIDAGESNGQEIDVQLWSPPKSASASFAETTVSPFSLSSVELEDGSWVCGPVCESYGLDGASDITDLGARNAYMAKQPIESFQRRRITRVLIANRGEIAVRIIRTLRRIKIEAVAVYSDADADAAHVRDADVALRLPGSTVAETYLNADKILALAKSVSANAIIPGYGFLAENADFARRVEAERMIWIGPTPEQMSELGMKHRARSIAAKAGVPTVPGSTGLLTSVDDALEEARRVGFPLMLKSSAGGGGIGLQRCEEAKDLEEALQSVQRLAAANFGDSSVFLERLIENARHIEIQILGDGTGRIIAAGERDCTLQRHHQKLVEESPAIMVPAHTRWQMRDAAMRLASAVKYRNIGTVEFLYDVDSQDFYFLEVNTRLQVEHPVTEAVTGLDLVEAMIEIAADGGRELFQRYPDGIVPTKGHAIEARLYAEDILENFRPCAGRILKLKFPLPELRVDTWISCGTEVSTSYDPLLAKFIAKGNTRKDAIARLAKGLTATQVVGLETNRQYLRQLLCNPMFHSGCYTTRSLDTFYPISVSFKVVEPGSLTTIQDWPGRTGYWNVGLPPCGPMDDVSFRLANRLVDNHQSCAGLECSIRGPSLKAHYDLVVAVVGASAPVHIDDKEVPMNQALKVPAGSTLKVGLVESGSRFYIAIRGGIDVPRVMGSRSTFELGQLGGFDGRKLQRGDLIQMGRGFESKTTDNNAPPVAPPVPIPPQGKAEWTIGVVPGPHGVPEFFTVDGLASLFESTWTVHYNSNRLGIRLQGPKPQWARQDGGEAGLHPSNIHDSPYSIGSVSFTGDDAVILTCDGPSLGGFVVFCVVASAEMWKLGQVRPGDTIKLRPITVQQAFELDAQLLRAINDLTPLPSLERTEDEGFSNMHDGIVLGTIHHNEQRIVIRQAGDSAVLLDFGDAREFRLRQSFEILAFMQQHQRYKQAIPGVEELTPGVCTLHIRYLFGTWPQTMVGRIALHVRSYTVPNQVPSRRVRLPLAFDDAVTRAAVERYAATIRADAPWLPSNVNFLAQLNGIDRDALRDILEASNFLVLGLGDVYLGSPCAVPLDPRHRLFGTKYNPSRTFTPKGAVGIGGQYMCSKSLMCPSTCKCSILSVQFHMCCFLPPPLFSFPCDASELRDIVNLHHMLSTAVNLVYYAETDTHLSKFMRPSLLVGINS